MELSFNRSSLLKYDGNFAALSNCPNCGVVMFGFIFSLEFSGFSLHVVEFVVKGLRKFSGMDFSAIWINEVLRIIVSIWNIVILSLERESGGEKRECKSKVY